MDADNFRNALFAIPSHDWGLWYRMGLVVKAERGEQGFALWDEWSRQSESYDARAAERQWRQFPAQPRDIGVGSLYHEAKKHGWTPEFDARPDPVPKRDPRREERKAEQAQRSAERSEEAAERADYIVRAAIPTRHPYLMRKGFNRHVPTLRNVGVRRTEVRGDPVEQLRYNDWTLASSPAGRVKNDSVDLIVLPMRLWHGDLTSIQFIDADSHKWFLSGGATRASVLRLGRSSHRWYCEGYATALSVVDALSLLHKHDEVVVCFSAHNLRRSSRHGLVIADNDASGTGEKAARETGLPYWMPPEEGDADDYRQRHGLRALATQLLDLTHSVREATA